MPFHVTSLWTFLLGGDKPIASSVAGQALVQIILGANLKFMCLIVFSSLSAIDSMSGAMVSPHI
jgi:hypothetical protein